MNCHRAVMSAVMIAWTVCYALISAAGAQNRPYRPGELLVQFKSGWRSGNRANLERSAGVRRSRAMGRSRIYHVVLEPGATVEQARAVFAANPDVEFAEPGTYILELRGENLFRVKLLVE